MYLRLLNVGGILVIDDCANNLKSGSRLSFGIEDVSRAVDELLPPLQQNNLLGELQMEHKFAVYHDRVWVRKK